jgi:hypothetical protein
MLEMANQLQTLSFFRAHCQYLLHHGLLPCGSDP